MNTVSYIPKTLEELGEALTHLTPNSLVLAGGTDLVLHMRAKHLEPDVLLSLSDIPQLREIQVTPEQASIGAMATMHQVQQALDGLEDLQALADAAPRIAEFARREGLEAHARSVCARAQQNKEVQP